MTGWAVIIISDVVLSMEKIDEQSDGKECEQKKEIQLQSVLFHLEFTSLIKLYYSEMAKDCQSYFTRLP